jgi:hypothetical protein
MRAAVVGEGATIKEHLARLQTVLEVAQCSGADRAAFLRQPYGALDRAGVDFVAALKGIWGLPDATDDEMLETLLCAVQRGQQEAGCGHCGGGGGRCYPEP